MFDPKLKEIERTLSHREWPKIFAVELNADCNLACAMCHHPQMKRPKGIMPLALFQRCADQIGAMAPDTDVWFSFCGEPLLSPERFFECIEYGARAGLRSMNLNTNGMYLTREVADRLVKSPLRLVVVGLDGFSKDVYERVRIGSHRETVYGNVEYLLEQSKRTGGPTPEVMVQFIEMNENVHELPAFKAHWLERGATVKVRNMLSWGGKFVSPVASIAADRIPCPWAITMMHVFWDGRVPRCPGDTEGEEGSGNAWDTPLLDLWAGLGGYRDLHLAHRFDELPDRCKKCTDWMTGAAVKLKPSARSVEATAGEMVG